MKTLMILCTVPDERLEIILEETREEGYRTVFCGDRMQDPPGRQAADLMTGRSAECKSDLVPADRIYRADWNNTEELIAIAEKEHIDGVVGLCDPAVIPAAAIAEALQLPGNPVSTVKLFLSKNAFRDLQEKAGVFCPRHAVVKDPAEMRQKCAGFYFPIIVKPMLSSSSHGMTTLHDASHMDAAFAEAAAVSRNGAVCVEEFMENDSLRVIESDVFVMDGDILWDGIRYCYRLPEAPLRPVYDVYPVRLTREEEEEYRRAVSSVLFKAGVRIGEFNVEGFFTKENRFFIIEINPRPAGHYTPQTVLFYTGVDLAKLLITTAVGDMHYYESLKTFRRESRYRYLLDHSVFSEKDGVFDHIHIDASLLPCLKKIRYLHGQKEGDHVRNIVDAVRPIAVMIFVFDSEEELEHAREHITELVYPVMR